MCGRQRHAEVLALAEHPRLRRRRTHASLRYVFAGRVVDRVRCGHSAHRYRSTAPLAVTIATLAFTGMRAGELQLLTRASIDLDQRWITIETLKAKLTRVRPLRRVPIHDRLLPLLRAYLQERKLGPTNNVFNSRNMKLIDLRRLNEQVKAVAASLSIPVGRAVDGLVVHSFHHFFETQAVNSNIPQQVIDTWLGHTSDRSMGAHYYRLSDGDSHTMMARVQF